MSLHRPFVSTEQRIRECHMRLLTKEMYGRPGSIGKATGHVYIQGRHGSCFEPEGKHFDDVLTWLARKHPQQLNATTLLYSDDPNAGHLKTMIVNKALWLANMLEFPDTYHGIVVDKPINQNPRYFTYRLCVTEDNVQRLATTKNYIRDIAIGDMNVRLATPYVKLAMDAVSAEICKFKEGIWIFGVGSVADNTPDTQIHTVSFFDAVGNTVHDMTTKVLETPDGIQKCFDQWRKIGVNVP